MYTTWKVDGFPLPLVLVYHGPLQIATELGSGVAWLAIYELMTVNGKHTMTNWIPPGSLT